MFRRQFLIGGGAALVGAGISAGCGGSPTSPGGVTPPPQPNPQPPPTPPPPTPASLRITRILAFGDSMTYGVASPPVTLRALDAGLALSYPFKLQTLLAARYSTQTVSVFNAGIAGRKATEDRSRLSRAIDDSAPELVLLLEGANDLNSIVGPAVNAAIDAAAAAIEDMVRDTAARGLPIIVATLPPQRPGGPKAGGIDYLGQYNTALKTMASKKGAILIDVNAQLPLALIGQDGLHPTESGYQTLADTMFEAIKTRYEITPPTDSR
jgi:lysophospholipase L1-like esterase